MKMTGTVDDRPCWVELVGKARPMFPRTEGPTWLERHNQVKKAWKGRKGIVTRTRTVRRRGGKGTKR